MEDEIENQTAETTDDLPEEIEGNDEGVNGDADIDNDEEFTDGKGAGQETEADDKEASKPNEKPEAEKDKAWKNEQNAEFARKRREAEQKALIQKTHDEAIIKATKGINPYTNEKMVDSEDVREYEAMLEIELKGGDPQADYSKFVKDKAREKAKEDAKIEASKKFVENDKIAFAEAYPEIKLDELVKDKDFQEFAKEMVGLLPMKTIYAKYEKFGKKATTKAAQILANNAATPGKLSTSTPPSPEKSISEMTSEEFAIFDEKVKRGEIKLK